MDDLKRISLMSKAKHLLYLVDACYGGLLTIGTRGLDSKSTPNWIEKITKNKSRQIITAGGRGEEVIEKSEWGHSAFTLNLIRGLKEGNADLNADSYITANELGMFLREKVTLDSENQQTPQYGRMTSQEGEFVFVYGSDDNKQTISLSSSANFIQTSRGLEIQIPEAFNIGTVKMNQYSAKILNDIAEYLKENPYKIVLIECHTDSYPVPGFGSFVYPDNWKLSVARANEISDYLLFQGIQPEKMMALGFADRWPFGNSWEDVYSGEITDSIIDSMNVTVNQRTKNRRINIVITNTEKEYGEANKTIYYEQKLLREYEGYKFVVSNTPKNISYKLIISKFDGNYTISSTFPPIVGPNTGQLLASIPHFIMQAPNESSELEKWEHSINDLEKRLSNWEVIAPMGDSLTTYWGKLGEYYFTFYVQ
jgi:flagellar motor protein MotB